MLVFTFFLTTLRDCGRSRATSQPNILALRHQVDVLNRSHGRRLRLTRFDRLLWAWPSRAWSEWRMVLVIVKLDTVIKWHRRGSRLFCTWKSRRRTGRPTVTQELRALIRTMSAANPLWGAPEPPPFQIPNTQPVLDQRFTAAATAIDCRFVVHRSPIGRHPLVRLERKAIEIRARKFGGAARI